MEMQGHISPQLLRIVTEHLESRSASFLSQVSLQVRMAGSTYLRRIYAVVDGPDGLEVVLHLLLERLG